MDHTYFLHIQVYHMLAITPNLHYSKMHECINRKVFHFSYNGAKVSELPRKEKGAQKHLKNDEISAWHSRANFSCHSPLLGLINIFKFIIGQGLFLSFHSFYTRGYFFPLIVPFFVIFSILILALSFHFIFSFEHLPCFFFFLFLSPLTNTKEWKFSPHTYFFANQSPRTTIVNSSLNSTTLEMGTRTWFFF